LLGAFHHELIPDIDPDIDPDLDLDQNLDQDPDPDLDQGLDSDQNLDPDPDPDQDQDLYFCLELFILLQEAKALNSTGLNIPYTRKSLSILPSCSIKFASLIDNLGAIKLYTAVIYTHKLAGINVVHTEQSDGLTHEAFKTFTFDRFD